MSTFDVKNPERWKKCLKLSALFITSMFLLGMFLGTLAGIADPDGGWAAWRVGMLVGVIFASVAIILAFIGSAIHIGDGF